MSAVINQFSILFITILFVHDALTDAPPNRLLFVQTVWRHGDRTPTQTFPSDPNTYDKWPQGFGQLTTRGMTQQFKLGDLIRRTYVVNGTQHGYQLDAAYNRSQIRIRSTDVDRTLMSAYSNLAGMYPSGSHITYPTDGSVKWPHKWSPIPVHTITETEDYLLNTQAKCPKAESAISNFYETDPEVQGNLTKYAPFLKWLEGPEAANLTDDQKPLKLENIWLIWDAVYIERHFDESTNIEAPSWTRGTFLLDGEEIEIVKLLSHLDFLGSYWYQRTDTAARLRGGPLLSTMIDNMRQYLACLPYEQGDVLDETECKEIHFVEGLKYHAFSAHDTSVLALTRALHDAQEVIHLAEKGLPRYAAAIAVELWADVKDEYFVRITYHDGVFYMLENDTHTSTWRPITKYTSGCPSNTEFCPLNTFVERSQMYYLDDRDMWDNECGNLPIFSHTRLTGISIGLGALCFCMLLAIVLLAVQNRRLRKKQRPQPYLDDGLSDTSDSQALIS